ncbi:hypothetical protein [Novosphingobium sp. CCH12-A3]|uniref:hypothetical protein n=1 Tax=Novosphingobium sp. CCH12-A3 TaxID=1768752 RepID=UPI000A57FE9E|nr:hypothetical protein [Novosphingobium sp. CCH12-A3]
MSVRSVAFAIAMVLLSSCAMLRDNVKGSFACQAPQGSCAPSSIIDDAALQAIASEDTTMIRGGMIDRGPGGRASAEVPAGTASKVRRTAGVQPAPRPQTSRVLRIVFPAHVDRYGRLHEAAAVQVALSESAIMPTLAERDGAALASSTRDLLGLAADAPELTLDGAASLTPAVPPAIPSHAAAGSRSAIQPESPVEAIKAEVAAVLAPARKAPDLPVATVQVP